MRLRTPVQHRPHRGARCRGLDPAIAAFAARAAQGHLGRARRLATDEAARSRRADVLRLPTRLGGVADALAAAADLYEAAAEESGASFADRDMTELAVARGDAVRRQGRGRQAAGEPAREPSRCAALPER